MPDSPARWHIVAPSSLARHGWPDESEWAVFNEASGDVHLLNSAAMAVLDRLSAGPASLEELCASAGTTESGQMREALGRLDRLGLVSPVFS